MKTTKSKPASKGKPKLAWEPDWLRQHRKREASYETIAAELLQLWETAERDFQRELEAVEIVGNMSPAAKERTDEIGLLMQVFAPARFLPEHWKRFGLPDLKREWHRRDLGTRIGPLETLLNADDFRLLWDHVEGALDLWESWRKKSEEAGIADVPWPAWAEGHPDLIVELEEVTGWINELQRQLQKLPSVTDKRIERANGVTGKAEAKLKKRPKGELDKQVDGLLKSDETKAGQISRILNKNYAGIYRPTTRKAVVGTVSWKEIHKKKAR